MTGEFWLGVLAGAVTTFGVLVVWGLVRISGREPRCSWCGGTRDKPTVLLGEACPDPWHTGESGWEF